MTYPIPKAEQKGVGLSELLTDVLRRDIEINETLKQQLAELLDRASREGGVEIRRRDGQAFLVRPAARSGSPLDVPGIDAGLSRKEILDLVRESRRSTGRLLPNSRAPHQSPHRGKGSPSRQGSALNPAWEEESGS